MSIETDQGAHYRFEYKGIKLDPARIAKIYKIENGMQFTMLKKILCCGKRGHNDYKEDLKDIICAAKRELEMLEEDSTETKIIFTNVNTPDGLISGTGRINTDWQPAEY